jgi:hypothetical protein
MFRIDTHEAGSTHVDVRVDGRLVAPYAEQLDAVVTPHVNAGRFVHLDLSGVGGMDRQGVRVLLDLAGRGVRLAHCPAFLTLWLRAENHSRIRDLS